MKPWPTTRLREAQRLWTVSAAVEHAIAEVGHRATVEQVANLGGFVKQTFYKSYNSMDHAIEIMLEGVDLTCEMLCRARAVDEMALVYEDFLLRFPHVECMLYATAVRQIPSYRQPVHSWLQKPKPLTNVTNTELLNWAACLFPVVDGEMKGNHF